MLLHDCRAKNAMANGPCGMHTFPKGIAMQICVKEAQGGATVKQRQDCRALRAMPCVRGAVIPHEEAEQRERENGAAVVLVYISERAPLTPVLRAGTFRAA